MAVYADRLFIVEVVGKYPDSYPKATASVVKVPLERFIILLVFIDRLPVGAVIEFKVVVFR